MHYYGSVDEIKSICTEFISHTFILKEISTSIKYLSSDCLLINEGTASIINNYENVLDYIINKSNFKSYRILDINVIKVDVENIIVSMTLYLKNKNKVVVNFSCLKKTSKVEIRKIFIEKKQELLNEKNISLTQVEPNKIFEINKKVDIEREAIINSIDGGYCSFRIEGLKIFPLYFSYKIPEFFGYTRKEFSKKFYSNIIENFPENKRKQLYQEIRKAIITDKPYSTSIEIIDKKGEINAIHLTFKKVKDSNGNDILNVLILGKNSEVKLHKDILNYMSLGIVVVKETSKEIIFMSNPAKSILENNPDLKAFVLEKKATTSMEVINEFNERVFETKVASGQYYEVKEKPIEWLGDIVKIKIITNLTSTKRILKSISENSKKLDLSIRSLNAFSWTYLVERDSLIVDNIYKNNFNLDTNFIIKFSSILKKLSLIHPQDRNVFYNEIEKIIKGSPKNIFCIRMKLQKDGEFKWCKLVNNLINEDNEPVKILITIQDISEDMGSMKKFINLSEQFEYEASEHLASYIVNLTQNSIEKIISSRGNINYNKFKKAEDIYKFSRNCRISDFNEVLDDTYMDVENLLNSYKEGLTNNNYLVSYSFNDKNLWVKKSFSLLKNPINNDILAFHYIKDATDEIHINQILDYTVKNHFDFIVRISLTNKQCNMIINPKYSPKTNQTRYKYNLKDFISFVYDRVELPKPTEKEYMGFLTDNLKKSKSFETYVEFKDNGKNVRKKINLYKINDFDESLILACSDITALTLADKKKTDALSNALELANQANKAKTTFLSAMSHDIRTPINAIIGMTNIALSDLEDSHQISQSFRVIKDSSLHLLSLINDILEMSAIESGKHEIKREPLNIENLVTTLLERVESIAKKKNVALIFDNNLSNPNFLGDSLAINRIIENIINNAIKFSSLNGNVVISVSDKALDLFDNNLLTISIKDSGVGIDNENIAKIFDSFYRTGNAAKGGIEGTGLGLSITKGLVDSIGGKISVESKVNYGTKFTIELPLIRLKDSIDSNISNNNYAFANNILDNMKILLVEDHPINALVAKKMLLNIGANVVSANDGQQAIDLFKRSSLSYYDIIFMDIQMPKVDGYEAAKTIRNLERSDAKNIPIIAMTANAFDEDVKKCLSCGMNAHLSKPIEINKLIMEVKKHTKKIV